MDAVLILVAVGAIVIAFLDGMLFQMWRERRKWQVDLGDDDTLASIVILED